MSHATHGTRPNTPLCMQLSYGLHCSIRRRVGTCSAWHMEIRISPCSLSTLPLTRQGTSIGKLKGPINLGDTSIIVKAVGPSEGGDGSPVSDFNSIIGKSSGVWRSVKTILHQDSRLVLSHAIIARMFYILQWVCRTP